LYNYCRLCIFVLIYLLFITALQASALTEQQTQLLEQLNQMDHQEFGALIEKADDCIIDRNFACVEKMIAKAAKFASNPEDKKTLRSTRQKLVSEREQVAKEERQLIEEEKKQAAIERRREEEQDRLDAAEERRQDAEQRRLDAEADRRERESADQ